MAQKSSVRNSFDRLRRFVLCASDLQKKRLRRQSDYEIYGNDTNIMALSCTAADEEIVPLSPNRAERIVCKNNTDVDNFSHPMHSENFEQKAVLSKGTRNPHLTFFLFLIDYKNYSQFTF